MVLVDHAAKYLPALHRRVQRYDDRPVMIGWPLLPGLMRPMSVFYFSDRPTCKQRSDLDFHVACMSVT
jgi:hypothetical protein